jgi:tetratricopeptide (TPR) repeat protein
MDVQQLQLMGKKPSNTRHSKQAKLFEPFGDRVAVLFDELELAVTWRRPSILLAVYDSELVRMDAEAALEQRLHKLGQRVHRLQVNEEQFDVPLVLSHRFDPDKAVFFVTGLKWGGGRGGNNAYRALNIRREYLVDGLIRVVFWLTEKEASVLPRRAPDFWSFRHRVVEFIEMPTLERIAFAPKERTRQSWVPQLSGREVASRIAFREALLLDLPEKAESLASRVDLLYALASLHWAKGDHKKSISLLKQDIDLAQNLQDPATLSRLWVGLGIVHREQEQLNLALSACRNAIEIDPKDAAPWGFLGVVYHDLGRFKEAIRACKKAIKLDPKKAEFWNSLGNIYRDLGRVDNAMAAYHKAIELDPNNVDSFYGFGNLFEGLGRANEAIDSYQKAVKLDPGDVDSWNNLGLLYTNLGRTEDAIHACRQAIKLASRESRAWNNLGNVYRNIGRYKSAINAYRKSGEYNPQNADSWNSRGHIYCISNRISDAITAYERGIELDPEDSTAHLFLAVCYRKIGLQQEAKTHIKIALPKIKGEKEYKRACFESVRGNVEKAVEFLQIALDKNQVSVDWIRRDPSLDFIRDDIHFRALLGA